MTHRNSWNRAEDSNLLAALIRPLSILVSLGLTPSLFADDPPPALPEPRIFHRAISFDDKIFVFGGGADDRFQILDPDKQTWSQRNAPFKQGPALLTAVAEERLYVLDPFTPELRSYDPKSDVWTKLKRPPRSRANPALAGYDGKLYLIGSYLGVPAEHSVEVYDPLTDSWSTGPPLPEIKKEDHFHLTAVLNDRLHVVGHYFGGRSHWVFDGEKWKAAAEAPAVCGWKGDALVAAGAGLLLFKPQFPTSTGQAPINPKEIFRYDPGKDRWESLGSLPKGYPKMFGASALTGGQIHIIGGDSDPTAVFRFDVAKRTWQRSAREQVE